MSVNSTRRLAAIMFTDIVGYSALTQSDESLALQVLERHNRLLRPFFGKYNGKEIKTIGDSFLVEFDSALDATDCAVAVQEYLHDYNLSTPEDWKIKLRIGIHLGDVVHRDDDILGDAVNIASRIEPLAEPEGICISEQLYYQIRNKTDYAFEQLEQTELKNIKFPTGTYKVVMPWQNKRVEEHRSVDRSSVVVKKRIAVLPFSNISSDPNDEYFADGITDEMISNLSKIRDLKVISRTSIMRYKTTTKNIEEIARELQVGSILEGTVRKASDNLRISVQLIDALSDEHIWSQVYDRKLDSVFGVQEEIALKVSQALTVQLLSDEKKDLERRATGNTLAYTLYLKGRYFWNERTREAVDKAMRYFEEAIKLDSRYALAYSGLADCYVI